MVYIQLYICASPITERKWSQYDLPPVEYLQNYPLVDGKLCNDVCQEKMAVVFCGGVHTLFGQEAGPCKGHEATQLGPLPLVVGVVDMRGSMLD